MQEALSRLLEVLTPRPLGHDVFEAPSQDLGWGAIFGGQVLGQGLRAAYHTVAEDRFAHSLHASFLRRGDANKPVRLEVERSRSGGSFSSRRVVALQDEKPILHMALSFQRDEPGHHHQSPAPEAHGPEGVFSERDLAQMFKDQIPEALREGLTSERAIELRDVDPMNPMALEKKSGNRQVWLRAADKLPDDRILHQCLLAYASDFYLLSTSMHPHGVHWIQPEMHVTSLDHALWFHRPPRLDDWLLHSMSSPWAGAGRGLVQGQIYDREGQLVASTTQEGLIRDRRLHG